MKKTDWTMYDYCKICDAPAGRPCTDLRYNRRRWGSHAFNVDRPHRYRVVLPTP